MQNDGKGSAEGKGRPSSGRVDDFSRCLFLIVSCLFDNFFIRVVVLVVHLRLTDDDGNFLLWILQVFLDRLFSVAPVEGKIAVSSGFLGYLDSTIGILRLLCHQIKLLI